MRRSTNRVLAVLAALLVAVLAACGGTAGTDEGGGYVLGAALPLSGPGASTAVTYQRGIEACVKWVNEKEGLPERVTVRYVDTAGETEKGTAAYTKLTTVDRASMVFSAFSSITTAMAPLAERIKVPVMNGGALSPSLANQRYVWNNIPFISTELAASLPYVMENMPALRRATLLYQDDVVGQGAVTVVEKAWAGDGRHLEVLPVTVNATSFTAQVDKVKAQDPDVIFIVYSGDSQAALIQQLRSAGVDAQLIGSSALQVSSVVKLPDATGTLFTLQAADLAAPDELTRFFMSEMNIKPGEGAPAIPANYCNGVLVWANAVKYLLQDGVEITGDALNKRFEEQGSIEAVGGPLQYLSDHTLKSDISINEIRDGMVKSIVTVPVGE